MNISLILVILGTFFFIMMMGGIHIIHEGHIGVYSRGGALLNGYSEPGMSTMIPIITRYSEVQITIQTDKVTNIPVNLFIFHICILKIKISS